MKRTRNIVVLIILIVGLTWAKLGAQPVLKPSEELFVSVMSSDIDYLSAMLKSSPMMSDDSSGVEFEVVNPEYVLTITKKEDMVIYNYMGDDFPIDINELGTVELYKSGAFLRIKYYN